MAKKDKGFIATQKVTQNEAEKLISFFKSFGNKLPSIESLQTKIENETITAKEGILLGFYNKGITARGIDDITITNFKQIDGKNATSEQRIEIKNKLKNELEKYINIGEGGSRQVKPKTIGSWVSGITNLEKYFDKTSETLDSPLKKAFNTDFVIHKLFKGVTSRPAAASIIGDAIDGVSVNTLGWEIEPSIGKRKLPIWIPSFKILRDDLRTAGKSWQGRDLVGTKGKFPAIQTAVDPDKHFETLFHGLQTIPDQDVRNYLYMSHFIPTRPAKILDLTYGEGEVIPYYDPDTKSIIFEPDPEEGGTLKKGQKGYHTIKVSDSMAAFIENIKNSKGLENGQLLFPSNEKDAFSKLISKSLADQGIEGFSKRTQLPAYDVWGRRFIRTLKDLRASTSSFYKKHFPEYKNALLQLMGHSFVAEAEKTEGVQIAYGGVDIPSDANYLNDSARLMEAQEQVFLKEWIKLHSEEIEEYESKTGKKLNLQTGHLPDLIRVNPTSGIYDSTSVPNGIKLTLNFDRLKDTGIGVVAGVDVLENTLDKLDLKKQIIADLGVNSDVADKIVVRLGDTARSFGDVSPEDVHIRLLSRLDMKDSENKQDSYYNKLTELDNEQTQEINQNEKGKKLEGVSVEEEQPQVSDKKSTVVTEPSVKQDPVGSISIKDPTIVEGKTPENITRWNIRPLSGSKITDAAILIGLFASQFIPSGKLAAKVSLPVLLKNKYVQESLAVSVEEPIFAAKTTGVPHDGGIGADYSVHLPEELSHDQMRDWLEAGRSFGDSTVPEVQRIGGHIINKYQPQFTSQAVSDKKTQDQYFKLTEHDFTTSVREDEKLGLGLRDFSYPPTIGPETEELVGMELSQIEGPDFLSRLKTYKTEKETEQEQMKQLFDLPT